MCPRRVAADAGGPLTGRPALPFIDWAGSRLDLVLCLVPHIEHVHGILANREDDPVAMRTLAVQQFPNFFREFVILGRDRASVGLGASVKDLLRDGVEPFHGGGGAIDGRRSSGRLREFLAPPSAR